MRKFLIYVSVIIFFTIFMELSLVLFLRNNENAYKYMAMMPSYIQELYFKFTLNDEYFGYFANCPRKYAAFRMIDRAASEGKADSLYFDRKLIIPYVSDSNVNFVGTDCPNLMEPIPRIARDEIKRIN
ncbi:hypothetical protein FDP22_19850 (plasmid) [Paroceanicella profunda]|uniref:Uncharacterized protein n=1 Tax=Paroceanicella profunda TaxID=2579971 RepID=A0A5B8G091_9RHOB|nr:hypothetical protein [Paroceanicella profunda]QDL94115.1 hypothetical protein FDP22_19850 [Paroceanicella profunda]